jgi:predicted lactoylglutathione lyase
MNKQPQMIFVNLPVTNLAQSKAFYKAVGFTQNDQFSDEASACMVLSETIMVMLLTHPKWKQFTTRSIPNPKETAQVLLCISRDSKKAVDDLVEAGKKAGGKADPNKTQDLGFMYGRSVEDPDGHIWETVWMNMSAASAQ